MPCVRAGEDVYKAYSFSSLFLFFSSPDMYMSLHFMGMTLFYLYVRLRVSASIWMIYIVDVESVHT